MAFWLTTWEGFGERSAEQNLALRCGLFERDERDGYLGYEDDLPIAWCQVGPRNSFPMLRQDVLTPEEESTWAITCFAVVPAARRRGVASRLLAEVISDLGERGVRFIEAYPRRGTVEEPEELWNGPEAMYRRAGFRFSQNVGPRAKYVLELGVPPRADSE